MGIGGLSNTDLSLYRLVKAGKHGLNLSLTDLYGSEIELPNLYEIIKSLFTRRPITIKIKERSEQLINRLIRVQSHVDKEVEKEIKKAGNKI